MSRRRRRLIELVASMLSVLPSFASNSVEIWNNQRKSELVIDVSCVAYSLTIDADSESWVGAWWLGPLVASGFMVVMAMPMLGFPRRLPGIGVINVVVAGMLSRI